MSRFPTPTIAYLVDKKGELHGTHSFYDKNPQQAVSHLNRNISRSTESRYQYTLTAPSSDDFLTHIEQLFETEART